MSGLFKKKKKVPPPKKVEEVAPMVEEEEAVYDDAEAEQDIYAQPDDDLPPEVPPPHRKSPIPVPEDSEDTYEPPCMNSSDVSEESGSDGRPPLPLPPRSGKDEKKQKGKSYGVELDTLKDAVVNLKKRQPGETDTSPTSPKPVLPSKPAPPAVKERKKAPPSESPASPPTNGTEVFVFNQDAEEDVYTDASSLRLSMQPWYHGDISRDEGARRVMNIGKDGAFLVRTSKKQDSQPYTLVLLYKDRVNNLKVRKRSDGQFALGEEKQNEIAFETEEQIIEYHKKNVVTLTGSTQGETTLSECPDGRKSS